MPADFTIFANRMRFFAAVFIFLGAASYGQSPVVPHKMHFAGMTLTIHDDAREEIQKDVDALSRPSRYQVMKVERAKTYFPIIEKIFAEENIPDDFKYLSLQESALVADAVSVSDAVGFWQFKDFTALSMGLRVDQQVDERMNIVSATRGAAKFLNQNNKIFDNWLYSLQAYQMGAGGAKKAVGDTHKGTRHMDITSETYWYVKKYLAHKVAFENALEGQATVKLVPVEVRSGKSLSEIASEVSIDETKLKEYNKWVRQGTIPADKIYTVLVPTGDLADFNNLVLSTQKVSPVVVAQSEKQGVVTDDRLVINGVPAIRANAGESVDALARRAGLSVSALLRNNEISSTHQLQAGLPYFLKKKKKQAEIEHYKISDNDNLWTVSQRYGVRMKSLEKYNHLVQGERLQPGVLVWMRGTKPDDVVFESQAVAELDDEEFEWGYGPEKYLKPFDQVQKEKVSAKTAIPEKNQEKQKVNEPSSTEVHAVVEHRVQAGDTYYSIAKTYSMKVMDLLNQNNLSVNDALRPGQIVKVNATWEPKAGVTEVPAANTQLIIHEVVPSDSLYSVARKYGVTIKDLLEWNEKKDLTLSVGEKLRVVQK